MNKLLVLGNGVSRQKFKDVIREWDGEVWGCNRAIFEYKDIPNLSLMTCDSSFLKEMMAFREKHGLQNQIEAIVKKIYQRDLTLEYPDIHLFEPERMYVGDSGINLVTLALERGYDDISVCGFDLGGPDIYVKTHYKRPKPTWVDRWRKLYRRYGLDKITFIGHDHKPFIKSSLPADTYSRVYTTGGDHLDTNYGIKNRKKDDSVLILGNGKSRLHSWGFIKSWTGEIWVCNKAYTEFPEFPRLDVVASVHLPVLREGRTYFKKNSVPADQTPRFLTSRQPIRDMEDMNDMFYEYFQDTRGWSTGNLLILEALYEGYGEIVLAGFDFGGADIYNPPRPGLQFRKQFLTILQEQNASQIHFLYGNTLTSIQQTEWRKNMKEGEFAPEETSMMLDTTKRVLVVGNAPSVLDQERGVDIDTKFDYIIRLNDFEVEKYEQYVGSRTTHWITGAGRRTTKRGRNTAGFQPMLYLPPGWWKAPRAIAQKVQKHLRLPFDKFYTIPLSEIEAAKRAYTFSERDPSTGLFTLLWLLSVLGFENVYTIGFEFFQKGVLHYFAPADKGSSTDHDWGDEIKMYAKYINEGRIHDLNQNPEVLSQLDTIEIQSQPVHSDTALVSMIDDGFVEPFRVFMYSLLRSNPWFDLPVILLDNGISHGNQERCKELYPHIEFRPIDKEMYRGVRFGETRKELQDTYYKLDLFSITGYERVVFLDLDVLVLGDIHDLFYNSHDIAAVRLYKRAIDNLTPNINSGVLSIGKKLLNTRIYNRLVAKAKTSGFSLPDQKIINLVFKGQIAYLPKKYNVEKRMIGSQNIRPDFNDPNQVTILHYVNEKPWASVHREGAEFEELYNMWHQMKAEMDAVLLQRRSQE